MTQDPDLQHRLVSRRLLAIAAAWLVAVLLASLLGGLARLPPPAIAALVAAGILLPTLAYALLPALQGWVQRIGQHRLMLMHTWRVPAALVFFGYGFAGQLPPLFWVLAGTGDLIAGSLAAWQARRPPSADGYRRFHAFGLADFVVAVGTGLTYTLLEDPRMAALTALPLALIPLFGVGISGASHLIAFDLLRRGQGMGAEGSYLVPKMRSPASPSPGTM